MVSAKVHRRLVEYRGRLWCLERFIRSEILIDLSVNGLMLDRDTLHKIFDSSVNVNRL